MKNKITFRILGILFAALLQIGLAKGQCPDGLSATTSVTTPILCYGGTGSARANPSGGISPYTYSWSSSGGTNSTINSYAISGTQTFSYTGTVQNFTIPAGVTQVTINLAGAAGGSGNGGTDDGTSFSGVCTVIPGHIISVAVGEAGGSSDNNVGYGSGGGGGTFVYDSNTVTLLAVAAGGGGDDIDGDGGGNGGTDLINNLTTSGPGYVITAAGGTGGNGGSGGAAQGGFGGGAGPGGGGAGWLSNGGNSADGGYGVANGGLDRANQFAGGTYPDGDGSEAGGYGGGGAGGLASGGGGGGYNGGGGGSDDEYNDGNGGGGGGSYLNGTVIVTPAATNIGNGSVTIQYLASSNSGLVAGTYSVAIADNNGCTTTANITVTQPTLLTISASAISNACYNVSNGNASAIPGGGVSPYTYSWSNGTTTSTTGATLSKGTYTVTVEDKNGCSATASVSITQPTQPVSAGTPVVTNACNATSNGSATVNPSGGSLPYTYSWSGGEGTKSTATGLSAGNYTITVHDNCGQSASARVTIKESTVITPTTSVTTPILCNGESTGAAKVIVTGGKSPYTYSWSSSGGTKSTISSYAYSNSETFSDTGVVLNFVVPSGVTQMTFNVAGAQGGTYQGTGGYGASFAGVCTVIPGHIISVAVGGQGGSTDEVDGCGGGGGTFVYDSNTVTLLAVAAGGGGDDYVGDGGGNAGTDLITNLTTTGPGINGDAAGGTSGNGGSGGSTGTGPAGGGAGWLSNGGNSIDGGEGIADGGEDRTNHFAGGTYPDGDESEAGGYGGGGAGGNSSGGAGGGYNGGGGGNDDINEDGNGGGGGGSYLNGTVISTPIATNIGNGSVTISYLVPVGTGLSAGTYSVTVTDTNGCTATASVTLTQPNPLRDSIASYVNISCSGLSDGSAMVGVKYGTSPYTYSWNSGGTKSTATGLSAGTYTITVKDNCGQSATTSVILTPPTSFTTPAITYTNVTCNGGNNGSASASELGGAPGNSNYLYQAAVQTFTVPAGVTQITMTVTGAAGGCGNTTAYVGGDGASFTGVATVTAGHVLGIVTGGKGSLGTGTSTGGGGGGGTYIWDESNTTLPIIVAGGGGGAGFAITGGGSGGTDIIGNSATNGSGGNTENGAGGTGGNGGGDVASNTSTGAGGAGWLSNGAGGVVELNGYTVYGGNDMSNGFTGGIGWASYPNGGYGGGGGGGLEGGGGGGGYNGGGGGTGAGSGYPGGGGGSYFNTAYGSLPATVTATNTGNGSVTISYPAVVAGAYTYSWSNGATTSSITGLSAGTYTVTLSNGCGGSVSASVIITQPLLMSTGISVVNACNGTSNGSVSASPSNGTSPYTYSWSGGRTNSTVTGLSIGTYTLTVHDNCGQSASAVATIKESTAITPTASVTTPILCNGGTGSAMAGATGGTSPYTYSWSSGGGTNATFSSNPVAGTYTVTITDANGCSVTTSVILTQPNALRDSIVTASTVNISSCNGTGSATVGVKYGTSPYTYSWNSGGTKSTATGLSAGNYTVTVKDNCGASVTASVTITQTTTLTTTASEIASATCGGNNGNASASPSGGTSPYTYSWSNGSTSNPTGTVLSIGTYTVTVHDNCGNSATASVTITQPVALSSTTASVTANVSCNGGNNGSASATPSGGASPYTYSWSNGATTRATGAILSTGTYTVTVEDYCGGSVTASVTITQPIALSTTASVTANVNCNGTDGSASASPFNGASPYTYSWSGGGGANSTATGLSIGIYTVTVHDHCGGLATASVTISQPTTLFATATVLSYACPGTSNGNAMANPSGGTSPYTYSWSNRSTTNPTGATLSVGTYSVTIRDNCGASATASVIITQSTALSTKASVITEVTCNGENTGIVSANPSNGSIPYTYLWSPGGATTSSVSGLSIGTYKVVVSDHCSSSATASVTITEPNALSVRPDSVLDNGTNNGIAVVTVNGGTPPYTYSWTPGGETTNRITGLSAGSYCCVITDKDGCTNTTCINTSTGIDNISNLSSVNIYPDPNTGRFTITGITPGQIVELYNYTGQKLSSVVVNNSTAYFDISTKANGVYLIRILNNGGTLVTQKKIIKTN